MCAVLWKTPKLYSMSLKVVIPSHKRWDRVIAKKLFPSPIICVAKSQEEKYKLFNPECEIVTHPDDIVGLIPKRNWMAKHFQDLFMVDDDVFQFKKIYNEKGEPCNIKDPNEVQRIVEELHELAEMLDVHLWGYTNRKTPVQYDEQSYLSFTRQITGCSYGVHYNENTWWNEELKLKEDFWISCYMKYKERRILTDERYTFVQKDTFVNSGGLSAIRNHDEEMRSILFMRKAFGDAIQLKGQGSNVREKTTNKVQYNIITNFKF